MRRREGRRRGCPEAEGQRRGKCHDSLFGSARGSGAKAFGWDSVPGVILVYIMPSSARGCALGVGSQP